MVKKRSPRAAKKAKQSTAKQATTQAKSPAKRAPKKKKAATTKRAANKSGGATKKKPVAKRKSASGEKKQPARKRKATAKKRPAALGRPKVPGTAELDQMFLKDYEARQVFEFLGVKTIKELEEHPPDEIIERLTGPMVRAVERIRKALAVNNRYLAGDQKFAVQFRKQIR